MNGRALLAAVLALPAAASGVASAHVRYVTEDVEPVAVARFLVSAFTDPTTVLALGGGAVAVGVLALAYLRIRPARRDVELFRESMAGYRDLVPWLLRLSIGLPLVGAGFAGYFFAPVVALDSAVATRLFGVGVGFLLVFGLATRLAAGVGLAGYLLGVLADPTLLLAFEYVPGFVAIVLVGGGRPSADDVLAILADDDRTLSSRLDPVYRRVVPLARRVESRSVWTPVVLRAGLGVSFLYLGITQKLMHPGRALEVVEKYDLTAVVPVAPELWVVGAGLTEALVGLFLLAGAFTRASAIVAIGLFVTTLFGLPDDPVLAHISLFGLVSALLVLGGGAYSFDRWAATEVDDEAATAGLVPE